MNDVCFVSGHLCLRVGYPGVVQSVGQSLENPPDVAQVDKSLEGVHHLEKSLDNDAALLLCQKRRIAKSQLDDAEEYREGSLSFLIIGILLSSLPSAPR